MMTPTEAQEVAEDLLAEGKEVVKRIGLLSDERDQIPRLASNANSPNGHPYDRLTQQMDELGKKAMGIWAQALVYATLSTRSVES